MIRLIIFDFDDTITDNSLLDFKSFYFTCRKFGIEFPTKNKGPSGHQFHSVTWIGGKYNIPIMFVDVEIPPTPNETANTNLFGMAKISVASQACWESLTSANHLFLGLFHESIGESCTGIDGFFHETVSMHPVGEVGPLLGGLPSDRSSIRP